jgi:hypothetical protein
MLPKATDFLGELQELEKVVGSQNIKVCASLHRKGFIISRKNQMKSKSTTFLQERTSIVTLTELF